MKLLIGALLLSAFLLTLVHTEETNEEVQEATTLPPKVGETDHQHTPEETKEYVSNLVDEYIDADKDGLVAVDELKVWLKSIHTNAMEDNVDRQWKYYEPEAKEILSWEGYNPEEKEVLSWEKYKKLTFPDEALNVEPPTSQSLALKEMLGKTERRWKVADENKDDLLTKEEFKLVLHPEESETMNEVLISETIEDMDSDENKEVSLEEYMIHLTKVGGTEKDDPNWVATQQGNFANYLDKNKDGSLDRDEIKVWVIPPYDRYEADAWRLISMAGKNQGSSLTKEDILNYHEYFIPHTFWHETPAPDPVQHDEF